MGSQCTYYPEPGPEGETGAGGVCPDCMDEGYASYFCSQVCYEANLVGDEILLSPGHKEDVKLTQQNRRLIDRRSTRRGASAIRRTSWIYSGRSVIWRLQLRRGGEQRVGTDLELELELRVLSVDIEGGGCYQGNAVDALHSRESK